MRFLFPVRHFFNHLPERETPIPIDEELELKAG